MAEPQPDEYGFWRTFSFLTKVKYGGIIGKVTAIAIVFLLVIGFALFVARGSLWAVLVLAFLAFAGFVFVVLQIRAIFKSNPEMATLDGTEVIRYTQAVLKSKNEMPARVIESTTDPELQTPASIPPKSEDE